MVVCGRQENIPGAFLLLIRHRAGLKPGEQLPSGSYYPIDTRCFNSRFQHKNILSGLTHCAGDKGIIYPGGTKDWQYFSRAGGRGLKWN